MPGMSEAIPPTTPATGPAPALPATEAAAIPPAPDASVAQPLVPPAAKRPLPPEIGGPSGPEPTRYGDWERKGRVSDF